MKNMKSLDTALLLSVLGIATVLSGPAFAQKPHHATHAKGSAIYNSDREYRPQTQSYSNDPSLTGGGSLGYNQMLLIH
jgi:hypothetical protein